MNRFIVSLLVVSAVCLPVFLGAAERPNIVFIFSDDHSYEAVSAYGGRLAEVAPTPEQLAMAAEFAEEQRARKAQDVATQKEQAQVKETRTRAEVQEKRQAAAAPGPTEMVDLQDVGPLPPPPPPRAREVISKIAW